VTSLLISEVFPPKKGGSGRWFWEIYSRLPRVDFVIAAGEHPGHEQFDQSHDLRVVRLPLAMSAWGLRSWQGLKGYWRTLRRLAPILRKHEVRHIHCGRCLPEGVMALALKWWTGVPYICYVHGEDVNAASESRELTWLVRQVLGAADFTIPNSMNTMRILQGEWGLPEQRVRLLHPGVDIRRFTPADRNAIVRARLGWDSRTVVLTVGRLQKRKGQDRMIEALHAVRKSVPDILYAIVGDGEERASLEQLVKQESLEKHVQFVGEPDDETLAQCYQQCDLFVLPNRQVGKDIEGFGMVLLEAQACGKPVVAGASGGTAETMSIPDTGRVVCCDGPNELAALVADLLADESLRRHMGERARQWVLERFDWDVLSKQAALLFRQDPLPSNKRLSTESVCS
jgi:phosphatidylinositol alpha-1,6-mannosyltransferase